MTSPIREIIAANICYYRKKARLTQEQLAGLAQAGQKTVSKIENGMENCSIDTIERLCIELGIPVYKAFIPREAIPVLDLLTDEIYGKGVFMLLYQYYLIMTTMENEEVENGKYDTYGIALRGYDKVQIEDISTDKKFVQYLIRLCNQYQVSPVHLFEVVQDVMTEYEEELLKL